MKTCSYCGHENENLAGSCPGCGSLLTVLDHEQEIAHFDKTAEKESRLARKLLTVRAARKPWLAPLRIEFRHVMLKSVLVAGIAAVTSWLGFAWAPAFAIGCCVAFVLIEVALLKVVRHKWALMGQWIDWEVVQHAAGTSAPEPGGEPITAGDEVN